MADSLTLEVGDKKLVLRDDRSLFFPEQSVLFIADLHLGKAETFQRAGLRVPHGNADDDLERLRAAIGETKADELFVLGDLVHGSRGLTDATRARFRQLEQLTTRLRCIGGNHDARAVSALADEGIGLLPEPLLSWGMLLSHRPLSPGEIGSGGINLCGHVHPCAGLGHGASSRRAPCFLLSASRLVLPAFASFSGCGPDSLGEPGEKRYWLGELGVVELPDVSGFRRKRR